MTVWTEPGLSNHSKIPRESPHAAADEDKKVLRVSVNLGSSEPMTISSTKYGCFKASIFYARCQANSSLRTAKKGQEFVS